MRMEWDALDSSATYPGALRVGPVVLAVGCIGATPAKYIDPARLSASLLPVAGEPLHYSLKSAPWLTARPFYEFTEKERYLLYFDPKYTDRITLHDFEFHGSWNLFGTTNTPGDWSECKIGVTAGRDATAKLRYIAYDDSGTVGVWIDGVKKGDVDFYSPIRGVARKYDLGELAEGTHTLRVQLLIQKNPTSRGNYVSLDGLDLSEHNPAGVRRWFLWQ